MRVAVLTSLYPTPRRPFEGIFAERRWRGMADRGHRVTVVQPLPFSPPVLSRGRRPDLQGIPRSTEQHGVEIRRPRYLHLPGLPAWNATAFAGAAGRPTRLAHPDVVVADYAWPAAAAVRSLTSSGFPCVICARGSDLRIADSHPKLRGRLAEALRAAVEWCGVGEHLLLFMSRIAGQPARGRLVPNGVDSATFTVRSKSDARPLRDLPPAARVVLVVGHLIPRKDPLLAVEIFAAARGRLGDARLVFIGEGPLEVEVSRLADELGVADHVVLPGPQPPHELATWYAAADCLLLCSTWEGRPNVVLESLACGRPVLATHSDGSAEVLEAFPQMIAESRDPGVLADRLTRLIDDPPSPETLRAAVVDLTWAASCERLEALLESAAAGDDSR
jgi:glycosyltransferase involved in cell wall biosynthesis